MTLEAFDQMSEEQQLKVLMKSGNVLSERKDDENRSFMYNVDRFYVIVKYCIKTDDLLGILALGTIDSRDRIEWKMLRMTPGFYKAQRERLN